MRIWTSSIVCALLAGCQTLPAADSAATAPDGVAFEVKSWGALVHSWAVTADGSGTSVTRVSASGSPWPPYTLEHRRFTLGPEALAKLRALAREIPRPAPTDDNCQNRMTDAAYGTLSFVNGNETEALAFYGGCFDAYYAPFIARVKAIDNLVLDVSEKAPVERREEVAAETD
jgi:hypothetical protein